MPTPKPRHHIEKTNFAETTEDDGFALQVSAKGLLDER